MVLIVPDWADDANAFGPSHGIPGVDEQLAGAEDVRVDKILRAHCSILSQAYEGNDRILDETVERICRAFEAASQ